MDRQPRRKGPGVPGRGVLFAVVLAAGCKSAGGPGSLEQALADYRAGAYLRAQEQAIQISRTAHGVRADEAAYLAGLCAYQRSDATGAREWLGRAARSRDPLTAGRSAAVLGLALERAGEDRQAAALFAEAARKLDGDDARLAAIHADRAYEAAGIVDDEAPGFTLQVGAFQERGRAEDAAGQADEMARQLGLDPARIVPSTDQRGRVLYLVQFGRFATRHEAAAVRGRLGQLQFIVASLAPRG